MTIYYSEEAPEGAPYVEAPENERPSPVIGRLRDKMRVSANKRPRGRKPENASSHPRQPTLVAED